MKQKSRDEILDEMGRVLIKGLQQEYGKGPGRFIKNLYGSAPVVYDKLIFLDEDKEKEWENLDPSVKSACVANLKETCSMMENKVAIELLCHVINDMGKRIKILEEEKGV